MELDVSKLLDQTVTVFNRLSARDSGAKADSYIATVLSPASWSEQADRSTDASGNVMRSRSVRIQVPATAAEYLPYEEWAQRAVESDLTGVYTLSLGDFAALGEMAAESPLSRSETVAAIKARPHCEVTAVRDLRGNGAVSVGGAAGKYAAVIFAEGA